MNLINEYSFVSHLVQLIYVKSDYEIEQYIFKFIEKYWLKISGIVITVLVYGITVNEFELPSRYSVHLRPIPFTSGLMPLKKIF